MVHVLATVKLKANQRDAFLECLQKNLPLVRAEAGCQEYTPAVDVDAELTVQQLDPDVVVIIEKWDSLAALHAHLQAPHMLTYREMVKDYVQSVTLKVLQNA